MADHRITDFVDQDAIDRLKELSAEMVTVKDTYVDVARELIKGLHIKVDGIDDLERMTNALAMQEQRAAQATETLNRNLAEQRQIIGNTTNTISRQLMEQEKINEKYRTAYERYTQVHDILGKVVGDYQGYTQRLAQIEIALNKINESKKAEKNAYDSGITSQKEYEAALAKLIDQHRQLSVEKSNLTRQMKMMEKEEQVAFTSYDAMSQQLAQMKRAYRELNEEGRNSEVGQTLLAEIKELGAHLKDLDASMGDFQRNVGDYAIACQNGVTNTDDLNRVLDIEAATVAGCIEQNKALEQAKLTLDTRDGNYAMTLERVNAKIEENKRRITDVDAILHKEATTVAEAEAQNKQLAEALKLIDLKSNGAERRIQELNEKIAQNKRIIEQTTPALNDNAKALEEQRQKSSGLVDEMLSLIGVNSKFGSSLSSLSGAAQGGSVIEGLGVKVQAFGKTVMGLLSNPWVLTFLGIAGVAAGFKWWYDYNKGLIEATRLTRDFTGKTGADLDHFQARVQAVADKWGKDFKDVLNATDAMAAQFGISFEQALSNIKDGFIANGDAQGDMLANLERFAPAFNQAGVSAEQFTAIVTQTRSGIFSTDGLTAMQMAFDRIRRMPKATKEAMQAIGIDTAKMQKDLTDGTITMMEAVQQVSAKLKELPENSTEVGNALFNVFGRKGPAAGVEMIKSIADINTNLDEEKEKLGKLAELQDEQFEKEAELNETLAAVFKMSDTSFEEMITSAKIFVTDGLIKIIEGAVDIVNWWIRIYNESRNVRKAFNNIILTFKTIWNVAKFVLSSIIDGFKAMGDVIEAVLSFDAKHITESFARIDAAAKRGIKAFGKSVGALFNEVAEDAAEAYNKTLSDHINEIALETTTTNEVVKNNPVVVEGNGEHTETEEERAARLKAAEQAAKAAEKAAKEELKRLNDLDEAKLKAMKEGHEKEMEAIRVNYRKKIREVRGQSQQEQETRGQLLVAMLQDLAECERKYQENKRSVDLANRLASAKKGSEEEFTVKMTMLEAEYAAEKLAAEKNGADLELIERKFARKRQDLREEYASARMAEIENEYAAEQVVADNFFARALAERKKQYAADLAAAGDNAQRRAAITAKYESDIAAIAENAAIDTAMRQVEMLEKVLQTDDLTTEERIKLEGELAKAKISVEDAIADAVVAANERIVQSDKDATEKRIANAQKWLQIASDGLNAINSLASAVYDAKVQKIEDEQTALDEAAQLEQERTTRLVEQNVITEEEGEARKRASEDATAKKQEELERKKQQIKYKQAVWDKANSIAQIGISTALAITQALPNLVLAGIAGAMGAIQLATVLATPIPKYAKGTDYHPGGLAIVGDAGEHEVVSVGSKMYITPKVPTLVDIPQGASVSPNIDKVLEDLVMAEPLVVRDRDKALGGAMNVTVENSYDYKRLERRFDELTLQVKKMGRRSHDDARKALFEAYKNSKI